MVVAYSNIGLTNVHTVSCGLNITIEHFDRVCLTKFSVLAASSYL